MPQQGSKMVAEEEEEEEETVAPAGDAKGKSATVVDDEAEPESRPGAVGPGPSDAGGAGNLSAQVKANASLSKALGSLSSKQVQDLLTRNPALAKDLLQEMAPDPNSEIDVAKLTEKLKSLDLPDIITGMSTGGKNAKDMASYQFWKTQPVPRFDEDPESLPDGPLENKTVDGVSRDPLPMIAKFEWVSMDITDEKEMDEVFELLNGHYVEDESASFRFAYSKEILRWALMAPGWRKEWHVGVRAQQSRKLVAFISGIPMRIRVRDNVIVTSEVNFLCVHKKLRNKRLAPVLIKEITRRSNLEGIWQGLYTGGVLLPKPVSTARYFHRPLRWTRLYEMGFSSVPKGSKVSFQERKFRLPADASLRGLREMKASDAPQVRDLLQRYLARFDMAPVFSEEEFNHWFVNKIEDQKQRVVFCYVVEGPDKKITDFTSFYRLESLCISKSANLRAAYLFYYATESGLGESFDQKEWRDRLVALQNDTLVMAYQSHFDVFNALSLMDNAAFLEKCKFKPGDGTLHFYLFNYRTKPITGGIDKTLALDGDKLSGMGVVLL